MDNFYDTAIRMHKSSETLHNNGEYHNACYLAGYVVECYAKIIIGLSYPLNYEDLKAFVHDLTKLRKEFEYIATYSSYSAYMIDMRASFPTILLNVFKWNPNNRYATHTIEWNQNHSIAYQSEIRLAMQKLAEIRNNGHTLI